ncbi:nicotinate-nucleotide adenylyltransferase [Psychrobacter aestuarii]|uniref:Nicotinate-nucleotide adenylyltransferase n=2 Tax=Psychrobacter aestuarii TaxID=556327 RepID=A0ABP3F6U3_9GAMM
MAQAVYGTLQRWHAPQQTVSVSLLPNARSPFKDESTAPSHRLAMIRQAIMGTTIDVSELELWQTPPVYSIDSVRTLRERFPHDCLIFIMGMDSARTLDKWREGLGLTDHVHLWIFNRYHNTDSNRGTSIDPKVLAEQLPSDLQARVVPEVSSLLTPWQAGKGAIYIDPRPIPAIASTDIRDALNGAEPAPDRVPDTLHRRVYRYIIEHQLYSAGKFR